MTCCLGLENGGVRGEPVGGKWEVTANGNGVYFWNDKNVLKFIVMKVAQLWEYTESHWIVHFKRMNCIVCDNNTLNLFFKSDLKSNNQNDFPWSIFVFIWKEIMCTHTHTHTAFPFSLLFGGAQSLATGSSSNHYTYLLMHFRCFVVPKNQSPTFLTWNWGLWGPIQTVGKSSVVTGNVNIYFNTYLKVDQCVKLFILQIFLKGLLCTRQCSGSLIYISEWNRRKDPYPAECTGEKDQSYRLVRYHLHWTLKDNSLPRWQELCMFNGRVRCSTAPVKTSDIYIVSLFFFGCATDNFSISVAYQQVPRACSASGRLLEHKEADQTIKYGVKLLLMSSPLTLHFVKASHMSKPNRNVTGKYTLPRVGGLHNHTAKGMHT